MNDAMVIAGGAVLSALLGWFFFGPRKVCRADDAGHRDNCRDSGRGDARGHPGAGEPAETAEAEQTAERGSLGNPRPEPDGPPEAPPACG